MSIEDDSDFDLTEAMMRHGGAFVAALGRLYRVADAHNRRILKNGFSKYFADYAKITKDNPNKQE